MCLLGQGADYNALRGHPDPSDPNYKGPFYCPKCPIQCFSGTSTIQTRRGVIKNAIRDGCSTVEYLVVLVCLIWFLLEHSVLKKLTKTMILSKGVLFMEQLVLGDSVLTISRDKGLIFTEVGKIMKK